MAEKRYKVIGQNPIQGADGKFVAPGEIVTLDPDASHAGATNVPALIEGGHVEEVKSGGSASATDKDAKGK